MVCIVQNYNKRGYTQSTQYTEVSSWILQYTSRGVCEQQMKIYPPCNHIYYDPIIDNVLKYTWLGNAESNSNARIIPFEIFLE